jgi:predicted restriction endonuclease
MPPTAFKKGQLDGEKHPLWKGGMIIYWKKQVLKRDDYTCRNCGLREPEIMDVAHIEPINGDRNRRYTPQNANNLIVLCPNCHRRFDKGLINLEVKTAHLKSR